MPSWPPGGGRWSRPGPERRGSRLLYVTQGELISEIDPCASKQIAGSARMAAAPGHVQPLSVQLNATSGHTGRHPASSGECLLSSRPQVRILLGAQFRPIFRCHVHHAEAIRGAKPPWWLVPSWLPAAAGRHDQALNVGILGFCTLRRVNSFRRSIPAHPNRSLARRGWRRRRP